VEYICSTVRICHLFITSLAESNRAPFDLPEAEQELVGGYNTEFSGMRFGMYYLSEYANIGTTSLIMTLLFLVVGHCQLTPKA